MRTRSRRWPDEVKAFRDTGGTAEELYAQVQIIVHRFRFGGALVGVWMGIAISGKLIAYSIRRAEPRLHGRSRYMHRVRTVFSCRVLWNSNGAD